MAKRRLLRKALKGSRTLASRLSSKATPHLSKGLGKFGEGLGKVGEKLDFLPRRAKAKVDIGAFKKGKGTKTFKFVGVDVKHNPKRSLNYKNVGKGVAYGGLGVGAAGLGGGVGIAAIRSSGRKRKRTTRKRRKR